MPTPHISAAPGDFADVVLMPGDPLRARFIAEEFLTGVRQVNNVRNMEGYTGTYQGRPVSVLGHGMGIPSISIYATELIKDYGARVLLRVGSCGAVRADVKVRDVLIGLGAGTDSKVNRVRCLDHDYPALGDFTLCRRAVEAAERRGRSVKVGTVWSADLFYSPQTALFDMLERIGVLGVEMEAAGLYGVAAEYGARALTLLTVSDHIRTGEKLSPSERATSFREMIELALDVALSEPLPAG
jgi:purine-nucleoside phosphorylase